MTENWSTSFSSCLQHEGQVSETGSGYTFFWKGKAQNEDRIHGVGFAIKTSLLRQFPSLPTGINERLMKLRIPISNKRFLTIISAYAPTLTSAEEVKEQFYADLDALLRTTPTNDKLLVLGDFNARVGRDSDQWKRCDRKAWDREDERQRPASAE